MLNPAPPADDLALAMKERKKLTFVALCSSRLAAAIPPNTKSTT